MQDTSQKIIPEGRPDRERKTQTQPAHCRCSGAILGLLQPDTDSETRTHMNRTEQLCRGMIRLLSTKSFSKEERQIALLPPFWPNFELIYVQSLLRHEITTLPHFSSVLALHFEPIKLSASRLGSPKPNC